VTARAIISSAANTDEIKVKWCPHAILCGDVDVIRLEGATTLNGGVSIRGTSKYNASQFYSGDVRGRLVAAKLTVAAASGSSNGTLYGGYGFDGRVVGEYSSDDIVRHLNEKSSVVTGADSGDVHLMYRPVDEQEREEWVVDPNTSPLGWVTSATEFPAQGIVIWHGKGDAADTVEVGPGGTYYNAGTYRDDLYVAGEQVTYYNAGSGYTLHTVGETVKTVLTAPIAEPDYGDYFFMYRTSDGGGFGAGTHALYKNGIDSKPDCAFVLGYHDDEFDDNLAIGYIDWNQLGREKNVRVEGKLLHPTGEAWVTISSWMMPASLQDYQNQGYTGDQLTIYATSYAHKAAVYSDLRFVIVDFYGTETLTNWDYGPAIRINCISLGVMGSGTYKGTLQFGTALPSTGSVTGTNLGAASTFTKIGTPTPVTVQGAQTTVYASATTVHHPQQFIVDVTAVVEYYGSAVSLNDSSMTRGAVPRPVDDYVGHAFSTPTTTRVRPDVIDSARRGGRMRTNDDEKDPFDD
jgi:hypothetical protein